MYTVSTVNSTERVHRVQNTLLDIYRYISRLPAVILASSVMKKWVSSANFLLMFIIALKKRMAIGTCSGNKVVNKLIFTTPFFNSGHEYTAVVFKL